MDWREAVLSALRAYSQHHATRIIHRQEFIAEKLDWIATATQSHGATPSQTLSRVLQDLRDERALEFLKAGSYLLLVDPIDVEAEDFTNDAIDAALRANRLKIGIVPTDTQQTVIRQRKGQARLRTLTLENYGAACAVCDVVERDLLIASHVVGWAEAPEHRGDLSNVICLCRIHDALFEAGYWSLNDGLRIVKKQAESKTISLVLDAMTAFRRPLEYPPAQSFVRRHREKAGFGP